MAAEQELIDLNLKIGAAEQERDADARKFLVNLVSDQLIFRRANGTVVRKQEFLEELDHPSPFKSREAGDPEVMLFDDRALVTLIVRVVRQDGTEVRYRNVRAFIERDGKWQLEFWYNYDLTKP